MQFLVGKSWLSYLAIVCTVRYPNFYSKMIMTDSRLLSQRAVLIDMYTVDP